MFSKEVYINRRQQLKKLMKSGVLLILGNNEAPMNYRSNTYKYRQDSNFLYFFGIDHPGFAGVIDIDKDTEYIFANDVDMDDIIWMGPQPLVKDQATEVGVSQSHPFNELHKLIAEAVKQGRKVHFLPPYRHDNMLLLEDLLGINPRELGKHASIELVKAVVQLRSVKEDVEIAEIEKACDVGYEMHVTAMKRCKPGIMEHTVAGAVEGVALSHDGMVSFPVILSQNGETLHNHYHGNKLTEGKLMLTDAGAEIASHYASDFTRTVPVGGKFSQKQKEIYNIVLAANNKAIEIAKPGITYQSVHLESALVIAKGLTELGLMKGSPEEAVKNGAHALFFPHGLGHMMGLDVHDMEDLGENYVGYDDETQRSTQFGLSALRMGRRLQKGFVVTVEPGIYFIPALIEQWKRDKTNEAFLNFAKIEEYLDFGGIRLEDDILITDNGCRILGGKRTPITVNEVEEAMKG